MIQLFSGNARFRNLAFVCIMALCPLFLHAQETSTGDKTKIQDPPVVQALTIDEAVQIAIKNNLGLQSSGIDLTTKKRRSDLAWNRFIPEVDLSGTLGRLNNKPDPVEIDLSFLPGGSIIAMGGTNQWNLAGNLSVGLNLNFALFEGMKNLKLDYQAGLISYDKAKQQLERDVRKAYYNILLMDANIKLLQDNLTSATQRVEMTRANYLAGMVPELTLLQAQVAMENLKPAILDLENTLAVMQSSFALYLGLPFGTVVQVTGVQTPDYIDINLREFITKATNARPEILELKQNIAVLQSAKKARTYQSYTPSVILGWNMDPTFQGDPMSDSWFMEDGWKQTSGMFRVTLALNLNSLLPFTPNGVALKEMQDTLDSLNISMMQLIRGTEIEVYQTVLQLEKSQTNMAALKLTETMALRSFQLTEQAYRNGLTELLDVQTASLEYRKAQNEVLKENFNYLSGLIDLEYAIGVPFGTLSGVKK